MIPVCKWEVWNVLRQDEREILRVYSLYGSMLLLQRKIAQKKKSDL